MNKSKTAVFISFILAVSLLAGCSGSSGTSDSDDEVVSITNVSYDPTR